MPQFLCCVRYSLIDRLILMLIFLLPIIPSPALSYWTGILLPIVIIIIFTISLYWCFLLPGLTVLNSKLILLTYLLLGSSLFYLVRIVMNWEIAELNYMLSRLLFCFTLLSLVIWIVKRSISIHLIYKFLFYGFLCSALFIIFVGITGLNILGEPRPPRLFGGDFPFNKTCGVPRSYGEFGVIASAAWSYFLIYSSKRNWLLKLVACALILFAIVIAQSRNTLLAIAMISLSYFFVRVQFLKKYSLIMFILTLFLPFFLFLIFPSFSDTYISDLFLASNTDIRNVESRFDHIKMVIQFMADDPVSFLRGVGHREFNDFLFSFLYKAGVIHNHFMANIIYTGFMSGCFFLGLYIIPLVAMFKRLITSDNNDVAFLYLTSIGTISSLHFYQGFFSITLILYLSALWATFLRS